jgi:competence ComEA-like helix-hairpin-helix protein
MKKFLCTIVAALPALALATVNVNSAQQSELERTKGLDKVKAKSIIEWRAANGSIDNFTELKLVPGFTDEVIERVKQDLAFEGDPYVPPPKPTKKKPATNTAATPAPRVQASR